MSEATDLAVACRESRLHSCPPSILCTSLRNYFTITLGGQVEVLEGKYAAVEALIELLGEFPLPKDTEPTR